jgi:hypothetical protein
MMGFHYFLRTLWTSKLYGFHSMALFMYIILLLTSSVLSVIAILNLLFSGDYRWWWRSFLCGGSSSIFLFLDSMIFYRYFSQMSGKLQTSFFFGQIFLFLYILFLSLGTFSFFINYILLRILYKAQKLD